MNYFFISTFLVGLAPRSRFGEVGVSDGGRTRNHSLHGGALFQLSYGDHRVRIDFGGAKLFSPHPVTSFQKNRTHLASRRDVIPCRFRARTARLDDGILRGSFEEGRAVSQPKTAGIARALLLRRVLKDLLLGREVPYRQRHDE